MNERSKAQRTAVLLPVCAVSLFCAACESPLQTAMRYDTFRVDPERLRDVAPLRIDAYAKPPDDVQEEERRIFNPFEGMERIEVTLEQCRAWALERNPDLRVALIEPVISGERLSEEEAKFESVIYSRLSYNNLTRPTASQLASNELETLEFDAGVRIPLRTGGTATVNLPLNRTETNNQFSILDPAYTINPGFSLSQPLLRNAGQRANTHSIRIALYDDQISQSRTKLEVIRQLANVERAYWRLYAAGRALEVRQMQYELAVEQFERARRLVRAGRVAEIEIIRAEAGVAERLEAIIVSETALRDAQRDLKRIINVPGLEMESRTLLQAATDPDPVRYELPGDELANVAVVERMEMLELELRLAQDASTIDFTRNQALPLFTVDYTYRLNALGGNPNRALDTLRTTDFDDHVVSLNTEIPLGNERAKARVQQAVLTRLQRLSTREARRLSIRQETLSAVDSVESGWQRILAARQSALLNGRALSAEQRQFDVGASTSTDVLDASTRLADSQLAEIRALAEYQIALVDLAFATGTLLGASKVSWDPVDPRDSDGRRIVDWSVPPVSRIP